VDSGKVAKVVTSVKLAIKNSLITIGMRSLVKRIKHPIIRRSLIMKNITQFRKNPVKKNMDKFHSPDTHIDKKKEEKKNPTETIRGRENWYERP
jgi:hypothetical protein